MLNNEMSRLLAEGGVMQEGGTVDPVSGNEVPPGAMQEEVRDDIDAKLSEGEFVFPADVVRYIGLDTLMKLRDKAKNGLQRMEEIGQMGNAEEVPDAEALHGEDSEMDDESFASEVDSILEEEGSEQEYARGGYVAPTSAQLSGAQQYATEQSQSDNQMYKNAPIRGFEMVAMTNEAGQVIYIPFINGVPQLTVPPGYKVKPAATETDTTTTTPVGAGGQAGRPVDQGPGDTDTSGAPTQGNVGFTIGPSGFAAPSTVSPTMAGVVGTVVGLVTGIPGMGLASKFVAEQSNKANTRAADAFNVAVRDTTDISNIDTSTLAATTGPQGTGGSASQAGRDAAAAAMAAGLGDVAAGAAAQAAANAVMSGASAAAAAAAGAAAAQAVASADQAEAAGTTAQSMQSMQDALNADQNALNDMNTGVVVGGPIGTPGAEPTSLAPSSPTETTPSSPVDTSPDSSPSSSPSDTSGMDAAGGSADLMAKGGFVKRKKSKPKPKTGLASR